MSYSDHFNDKAGLDAYLTYQVLAGNLDLEGGSVNGRIATDTANIGQSERAQQKQKKKDADFVLIVTQLQELREQMDKRIAELDRQIEALELQLAETQERAQDAFDKMHELEDFIAQAEVNGITNENRDELKALLGKQGEDMTDEQILEAVRAAKTEAETEGMTATIEAETIKRDLEQTIQAKLELELARDEIMSNPDYTDEQKVALGRDALNKSLDTNIYGTERVRDSAVTKTNLSADNDSNHLRSELTEEDTFDLDEDLELDTTMLTPSP